MSLGRPRENLLGGNACNIYARESRGDKREFEHKFDRLHSNKFTKLAVYEHIQNINRTKQALGAHKIHVIFMISKLKARSYTKTILHEPHSLLKGELGRNMKRSDDYVDHR